MSELILLLILNSFYIIGLFHSAMFEWKSNFMYKPNRKNMRIENIDSQYNMILWRVRYYSLKYIGDKWSKPVITCPTCMSSLHSTYFYFGYAYWQNQINLIETFVIYPFYVLMLAGINTFIMNLTEKK
jgi:hypothetical protein